jgi:hypothetical protein
MHHRLLALPAAAAVVALAVAPAAAFAGHGKTTHSGAAHARACKARTHLYAVVGSVIDGSGLSQVAGGSTHAGSDDLFSGDLIVTVTGGDRRGQRDLGDETYTLDHAQVPHRGTLSDASLAPGTEVRLRGSVLGSPAGCTSSGSAGNGSGPSSAGGDPTDATDPAAIDDGSGDPSLGDLSADDPNAIDDGSGDDSTSDPTGSDDGSGDASDVDDGTADDGSGDGSFGQDAPLVTDVAITTLLLPGQHVPASHGAHPHAPRG